MIPVELQPEPNDFVERVKKAGILFLSQVPCPSSQQWVGREYWRKVLPDMRKAYNSICAYSAHWIPHSTGNHSVDHFIPKSKRPDLAYEWSNFRYVSARFNSRKGIKSILDPFELQPDWFVMDFKSFLIFPNSTISAEQQSMVHETIECLKLNADDDLVAERQAWFLNYYSGEISFEHLGKHSPFIAYEVLRQRIEPPTRN